MAGAAVESVTIVRTDADGVAELRLERPAKRNAVTTGLLRELIAHLDAAEREGARAIVLTGAPPTFCAGADLDELGPDAPEERRLARIRLVGEAITRLSASPLPTIAAVEGAAIGAGWGLALACDVCFATAGARFGLPEVAKGFRIPPELVQRLAEVVGPTSAAYLAYTGEPQTAEQGLERGFVSRVLGDRDELLAAAHELAASLASRPPASVAAVKRSRT